MSELSFKYPTSDPVLTNNSDPDLQSFCDLALKELGQRNCRPNPDDGPFIGGSQSFEDNMEDLINMVTPYVQRWHRGYRLTQSWHRGGIVFLSYAVCDTGELHS